MSVPATRHGRAVTRIVEALRNWAPFGENLYGRAATHVVRALLDMGVETTCDRAVRCYSGHVTMLIRAMLVAAVMIGGSASAADAQDRDKAKEQVEFGIKVAQAGLWKEAAYRWERAVEFDPSYASAWNNLAIAYEQQGNFEKANGAYEKAVQLAPDNLLIQQNYDLFKEINDRTKRRGDR